MLLPRFLLRSWIVIASDSVRKDVASLARAANLLLSIRTRIRDFTQHRDWAGLSDIRDVIGLLNPVLRGWGGYFRTGNASGKFNQADAYVRERLLRLLARRGGQRGWQPGGRPFNPQEWPHRRLVQEHGLYQLLGTIRYPGGTYVA